MTCYQQSLDWNGSLLYSVNCGRGAPTFLGPSLPCAVGTRVVLVQPTVRVAKGRTWEAIQGELDMQESSLWVLIGNHVLPNSRSVFFSLVCILSWTDLIGALASQRRSFRGRLGFHLQGEFGISVILPYKCIGPAASSWQCLLIGLPQSAPSPSPVGWDVKLPALLALSC